MGGTIERTLLEFCSKSYSSFERNHISGKVNLMGRPPDFLKRYTLFSSICLLLLMEVVGHALWLLGVIPDSNTGGTILYSYMPLAWLVITIILVGRKFL
jgi:hypothetical protein